MIKNCLKSKLIRTPLLVFVTAINITSSTITHAEIFGCIIDSIVPETAPPSTPRTINVSCYNDTSNGTGKIYWCASDGDSTSCSMETTFNFTNGYAGFQLTLNTLIGDSYCGANKVQLVYSFSENMTGWGHSLWSSYIVDCPASLDIVVTSLATKNSEGQDTTQFNSGDIVGLYIYAHRQAGSGSTLVSWKVYDESNNEITSMRGSMSTDIYTSQDYYTFYWPPQIPFDKAGKMTFTGQVGTSSKSMNFWVNTPPPPPTGLCYISGKVLSPNETPMQGITIQLRKDYVDGQIVKSTTTSSDGYYLLNDLSTGTYYWKPITAGYYYTPVNPSITLTTDACYYTAGNFIATTQPLSTISGYIRDLSNSGIPEVQVNYYRNGTYLGYTTTNSQGAYELGSLAEGTYKIEPIKSGYSFNPPYKDNIIVPPSHNDVNWGPDANTSPNTPSQPTGPITGKPSVSYSYSTSATDPDGDQVKYIFDWGDGTMSETSYVNSGISASETHSWTNIGTYYIRAKAVDINGGESDWSATLTVTISGLPISGNVKDKNGNNVLGAEMQARVGDQIITHTYTDISGNYTLTNLSNQNYEVKAIWDKDTSSLISSAWQTVPADSTNINFTLNCEAGSISGQILGFKKSSVSSAGKYSAMGISGNDVFIEVSHNNRIIAKVPVDGDGNYKIKGLLPGKFILRGYNGYIYSKPKVVTLSEGQNAVMNFDFNFEHMPENETYTFPNPSKTGRLSFRFYCDYTDPEFEIKVYSVSGELLTIIKDDKMDKTKKPIYYYKDWECKTDSGEKYASGIYIYVVKVKDRVGGEEVKVTKKFAIVK